MFQLPVAVISAVTIDDKTDLSVHCQ